MKKFILLLIIICFSSCRYFNVSPANGITTKNVTEKPELNELVGDWQVDSISSTMLVEKGYKEKNIQLKLNANGSFQATHLPDFINVFGGSEKTFFNAKGLWEIVQNDNQENWVVQLNFAANKENRNGFATEFELYRHNDQLILWYFVGDPDLRERLLFEKKS